MDSFGQKFLITWVILIPVAYAYSYFVQEPPDGFFNRTSIEDCPKIFYYNWTQPAGTTLPAYGGYRLYAGQFPHMAAIGWTLHEKIVYKCGGTLITEKFVLTAAHCATDDNNTHPDTVRLGDTHLESTEDDENAQQIKILAFKRHPNHKLRKSYFDIALIELETYANITFHVCPACLWLENDLPNQQMQSLGFGATEFADSSPTLQGVTLAVMEEKNCSERFSPILRQFPDGIADHQFCAGSSSMDTCQGDSGGPIQVKRVDVDGNMYSLVVGIVSFGSICTSGSFGVYTRIAPFRNWIENETNKSMDYWTCTTSTRSSYTIYTNITHTYEKPAQPFNRVGLLWEISDHNSYQCGAVMIDYQYAITSAVCVNMKQYPPKFITIEQTGETVEIEKIFTHPFYSPEFITYDMALLRLSKYLKGDNYLLPACLTRNPNISFKNFVQFSAYTEHPSYGFSKAFSFDLSTSNNGECKISTKMQSAFVCANHHIPFIPTLCKMDYGGPVTTSVQLPEDQLPEVQLPEVPFPFQIIKRKHARQGTAIQYLLGIVSNVTIRCGEYLFGTRLLDDDIDWIENIVLQ